MSELLHTPFDLSMTITLEALEEIAARVRAGAFVAQDSIDALRQRYPLAYAESEALAMLMAEAWVRARTEASRVALALAWKTEPIALPHERPIELDRLESAIVLERNDGKRRALWQAASERARDHFRAARSVVEALRARATELAIAPTDALVDRLGLGRAALADRAVEAVLRGTEGAFDELDPWALRECGLGERVAAARRGDLTWDERLRSLSQPRASAAVPLGDRGAGCARWIGRVGLGDVLSSIVDHLETTRVDASRIRVRVEREGERVILSGEEDPTVDGGARCAAAYGEALAWALPRVGLARERAGVDRLHAVASALLARGLLCERAFVTRELGVDPARASLVARASTHGMMVALRRSAAEATFARDALCARPELAARLREGYARAVRSPIDPAWAVHVAAQAIERRAEATVIAALIEATLRESLRERFDEDWFRNPRAGEGLAGELASMRSRGAIAWLLETTGAADEGTALERASAALSLRWRESFERATR